MTQLNTKSIQVILQAEYLEVNQNSKVKAGLFFIVQIDIKSTLISPRFRIICPVTGTINLDNYRMV